VRQPVDVRTEADRATAANQQRVEDTEARVGTFITVGHGAAAYDRAGRLQPVILARMARRRDGFRWGRVILIVLALLVINVPYGLHEWSVHRAATDGVPVTATVVGVDRAGNDAVVSFRLPKNVDEKQKVRTVKVPEDVGLRAAQSRRLEVDVLQGNPDAFHVDGQVRSWGGLVLVLVADALIVLMVLLSWRFGGRLRRPTLIGIAVEDVGPGARESLLDKQEDGTYVIGGEVAETGPSSLVLRLRDRDVEISLRDHENPIAIGEWARVRAQLVG
jgi:hypothetical protein